MVLFTWPRWKFTARNLLGGMTFRPKVHFNRFLSLILIANHNSDKKQNLRQFINIIHSTKYYLVFHFGRLELSRLFCRIFGYEWCITSDRKKIKCVIVGRHETILLSRFKQVVAYSKNYSLRLLPLLLQLPCIISWEK